MRIPFTVPRESLNRGVPRELLETPFKPTLGTLQVARHVPLKLYIFLPLRAVYSHYLGGFIGSSIYINGRAP